MIRKIKEGIYIMFIILLNPTNEKYLCKTFKCNYWYKKTIHKYLSGVLKILFFSYSVYIYLFIY